MFGTTFPGCIPIFTDHETGSGGGHMRSLFGLFTNHPATVGETYLEHMAMSFGFSMRMLGGCLACLVHGLLPFLFVRTGSDQIRVLHDRMVAHRDRRPSRIDGRSGGNA